ncbi:hypothetical protein L484_006110 [Morus notabilis]|uniref:Uncharacterized protein n=1 Tax=Morus notabilis TaxID=981085 RepID=W9SYZ0_9ROSA|nr:hypothetical protein L484_006110 [Morus notabilis]
MDLFEMVNHFFKREREVIQNPLAPEPVEVPHADPHQEQHLRITAGIEVSRAQGDAAAGCHGGAMILLSGTIKGTAFLQLSEGQKGEGCEGGLVIHTSGRMNGGPTDPGFHERWRVLECLSRALVHTLGTQQRGTTRPYSQRGGWHYWQRPSGKNAAGAKRGRPAPGEHRKGRELGWWKSQGRPGHLTEMEGFSPIREGPMK